MKKVPALNDVELDLSRYSLGRLCKRGHDWRGTGKSLRYVDHRNCIICNQQAAEARYTRTKRTGTGAIEWTPQEDSIVRQYYGITPSKELAKILPGRTYKAVRRRANILGVIAQKQWSDADIEFLRDNYGKVSNSTIAKLLGRSVSAIGAQAGYIGLTVSDKKWTQDEDDLLTQIYRSKTREELADLFGTTKPSIQHRAQKLGLTQPRKRYHCNDAFFAEITSLSCYWAGFLATDGCVLKKSGIRAEGLQLSLSVKDVSHIQRFAKDTSSTYPIRVFQPKVTKRVQNRDIVGGLAARTIIYSRQWTEDLESNFYIVPQKTYILKPPTHLHGNLAIAYIAGFVDGDGSIKLDTRKPSTQVGITMSSASKPMLDWIKSVVDQEFSSTDFMRLTSMKLSNVRKVNKEEGYAPHWRYGFYGARAKGLAIKVFEMGLPILDRKWGKIKPLLATPLLDYVD